MEVPGEKRLRRKGARASVLCNDSHLLDQSPSLVHFSIQLQQTLPTTQLIQILATYFTPSIVRLKPHYVFIVLQSGFGFL